MMRRWIVFVALCFAACGREAPETTTLPASPPRSRTATSLGGVIPEQPPAAVRAANRSTPQKCAGDGSYELAIDCFRITAGFHFAIRDTTGRAEGEMTRSTPGMERVRFRTSDGAEWVGEAKPSGVVWSRNGKHEQSPPDITNRIWQRTTMVLDPRKTEVVPQLAGVEPVGGEPCNHVQFTNANSGEANDVWVSTRDGRIVKWTAGASTLELR